MEDPTEQVQNETMRMILGSAPPLNVPGICNRVLEDSPLNFFDFQLLCFCNTIIP